MCIFLSGGCWSKELNGFPKKLELATAAVNYYWYDHPSLKGRLIIDDDIGFMLSPHVLKPYLAGLPIYEEWLVYLREREIRGRERAARRREKAARINSKVNSKILNSNTY